MGVIDKIAELMKSNMSIEDINTILEDLETALDKRIAVFKRVNNK